MVEDAGDDGRKEDLAFYFHFNLSSFSLGFTFSDDDVNRMNT